MGYGPRGIDPVSTQTAEGDKQFFEFVYNDTSGALSNGQPLYCDNLDSAEFNSANSATAVVPAAGRTGGFVVLGTNARAGASLLCVGVFQPTNSNQLPNKGDLVRVLSFGRGIASVQSPAAGSAGLVGGTIIASTAVKDAVPGTRASGLTIGVITATTTHVTTGSSVIAAASATATLVNAFINLT